MKNLDKFFGTILGLITYLVGGFDNLLITLLIFMFLDYVTGVIKGIVKKELSSKKSMIGILKKIGYIFIIILSTFFDKITIDGENAIRTLTLYFFIANEAISILENWALIGLPLPKKLLEVFNKFMN